MKQLWENYGKIGEIWKTKWETTGKYGKSYRNNMVKSGQIPCKWVNQTWFQWGMPEVNVYFNELFIAIFPRHIDPKVPSYGPRRPPHPMKSHSLANGLSAPGCIDAYPLCRTGSKAKWRKSASASATLLALVGGVAVALAQAAHKRRGGGSCTTGATSLGCSSDMLMNPQKSSWMLMTHTSGWILRNHHESCHLVDNNPTEYHRIPYLSPILLGLLSHFLIIESHRIPDN